MHIYSYKTKEESVYEIVDTVIDILHGSTASHIYIAILYKREQT
jgi:hypothetical protein